MTEKKKTLKLSFGQRELGIAIFLISILVGFLFYYLYNQLVEAGATGCGCGADTCPAATNPPIYVYVGFTFIFFIAIAGIYLALSPETPSPVGREEWNKRLKTLKEDEKILCQLLLDNDGVLFQSDLVQKSGMNKVKVSRTLDLLQSRGLIERRRQGMANVVILKNR